MPALTSGRGHGQPLAMQHPNETGQLGLLQPSRGEALFEQRNKIVERMSPVEESQYEVLFFAQVVIPQRYRVLHGPQTLAAHGCG